MTSRHTAIWAATTMFGALRVRSQLTLVSSRYFSTVENSLLIEQTEYASRRDLLAERLSEGECAVVVGHGYRYRSKGIFYPFTQNTDFLYLCGQKQPNSVMIIGEKFFKEMHIKGNSIKTHECQTDKTEATHSKPYKWTMFMTFPNRTVELWDGPSVKPGELAAKLGIDEVRPIEEFPKALASKLDGGVRPTSIYCNVGSPLELVGHGIQFSSAVMMTSPVSASVTLNTLASKLAKHMKTMFKPLGTILDPLRCRKSLKEIQIMRKSGQISGRSIAEMMYATKTAKSEAELEAIMEYGVRKRGATGLAYVPVIASGTNALTLHYVRNNAPLRHGDMVMIDAGGSYLDYASDISRAFPVTGKFSKGQAELYNAVLSVNRECIKLCKENLRMSLDDIHQQSFDLLRDRLSALFERKLSVKEMNRLYPHHVGHYLGMDVHDSPSVPRSIPLESRHVITIEPGVYVPHSTDYPERFRGIGIRVEDNVVVGGQDLQTGGEPLVLTTEAPKEIADIEAVMNGMVRLS